jgi:hypothetical protein
MYARASKNGADGILFALARRALARRWRVVMKRHRLRIASLAVLLFGPSFISHSGWSSLRAGQQTDRVRRDQAMTLTLRPSTLADHIEELAGQHVSILNARVVGLFGSNALLIEPAKRYLEPLGYRDRILVLIDAADLRIPAESIVSSTVRVLGIARTLLSLQVTAEVPWPAQLDRDLIKRLEVRAAVLATSVQTSEGTELTSQRAMRSQGPAAARQPSPKSEPRRH